MAGDEDERLAMVNVNDPEDDDDDRPYYYVIDRMYNVRYLVDRAGAIVERYAYDPYGRPLIRESLGRGDTRVDIQIAVHGDSRAFLSGSALSRVKARA